MYQIRNLTAGSLSLTVPSGDNIALPPNGESFVPVLTGEMLGLYPRVININPPPKLDGTEVNDPQLIDVDALIAEAKFFRDFRDGNTDMSEWSAQSGSIQAVPDRVKGLALRSWIAYPQDSVRINLGRVSTATPFTLMSISHNDDNDGIPVLGGGDNYTDTFHNMFVEVTQSAPGAGIDAYVDSIGYANASLAGQGKYARFVYIQSQAVDNDYPSILSTVGPTSYGSYIALAQRVGAVGTGSGMMSCTFFSQSTNEVSTSMYASFGETFYTGSLGKTWSLLSPGYDITLYLSAGSYSRGNTVFPSTVATSYCKAVGLWLRKLTRAEMEALKARLYY